MEFLGTKRAKKKIIGVEDSGRGTLEQVKKPRWDRANDYHFLGF